MPAVREAEATGVSGAPKMQPGGRLQELIDYVLTNTDNVGKQFAEEARRMHYQEAPYRNIRGTTSRREAEDLLEEGIPVMALPIPPQGDWH